MQSGQHTVFFLLSPNTLQDTCLDSFSVKLPVVNSCKVCLWILCLCLTQHLFSQPVNDGQCQEEVTDKMQQKKEEQSSRANQVSAVSANSALDWCSSSLAK